MKAKKQLRPHQVPALEAVKKDSVRLIVASSLWRAERGKIYLSADSGSCRRTRENGAVSVPSLALLSQTLDEWTQDTLMICAVSRSALIVMLARKTMMQCCRRDQ